VASDARRSGLANELDSRDRIANLFTGRTSVARAQWAAYEEPRRFLFFRNVSRPIDRLWAALAGVLSAVLSLAAFCRGGDAARRTMEAAE
jgi:hypothetical protein